MLYIKDICNLHLCLPCESICSVEGTLVFDSSFSKAGNHVMTVFIKKIFTVSGQSSTSSGLVTAIGKEKAVVTSGLNIRLFGHFNDSGIFVYDSFQVTSRSFLNSLRAFIIPHLEKRITGKDIDEAEVLSMMLILGRGETYSNQIKSLASQCGCIHVLALSGMHLHAVTLPANAIRNKYVRYITKFILTGIFLLVAGPRPSLVRSALFIVLSFLPVYERLIVSLILHILIFPLSLSNIGAVYGYAAVFALVLLAPFICASLSYYIRPFAAGILGSSIAVLCLTAPLQLLSEGYWQPIAVISGPLASFLSMISMSIGFLTLITGPNTILFCINSIIYETLIKLFELFGTVPDGNCFSYLVFLVLCILVIVHKVKIR